MRNRLLIASALAALTACGTTSEPRADPAAVSDAAAATPAQTEGRAAAAATTSFAVLAAYRPTPSRSASINYALIDEALDTVVFNGGPSTRRPAPRLEASLGSRVRKGHESRFRLEGNKIFFSQFDDETTASVSEYRQSLEDIGRRVDITQLSRNEQLAYWFNLHNLVVIDEIAQRYPVQRPARMRPVGEDALLHEAKIIDLGGPERLSLRDVREIVYTHWDDPRVMYGFFHGDVGGPSIRSEAYTGDNVGERLDRQAREFVNSLRGLSSGRRKLFVSRIYSEGRPHFFPVWPGALKSHLLEFADEEVAELIRTRDVVAYGQYDDRVADLAGGEPGMNLNAGPASPGIPPSVTRMVTEYREKLEVLRRDGRLKPRVIIIDVPTEDTGGEVD